MSDEEYKVKEAVEVDLNAGQEYQEVMMKRVDYFAKKNAEKSVFNNFMQNTVVKSLSTILDLKVKIDNALGEENLKKIHDVFDELLLFGL